MRNGPRSRIAIEGLRAALLLLLIPALAIAAAWLLGTRLPEDHTATASGLIQAPPDRVWQLLTDFASQEEWRTGPLVIDRTAPMRASPRPCWREAWLLLKMMPLCEIEAETNRHRVVQTANAPLPFAATWTYDLVPSGPGTTSLTITEQSVIDPPGWRFIGQYILRTHTTPRQTLHDLQAEALRHP